MKKDQRYIDAWGRILPTPHRNITAVTTSYNLEKTNPSEIKVGHIEIISIWIKTIVNFIPL